MHAVDSSMSRSQPGEKFFHRSRPGHFRKRVPHPGDRVRVAAGNRDFSETRRKPSSTVVGLRPHLSVACLKRWDVGLKPMEVFFFAAARQPGENVIGAEEKLTLGEVHQQRDEIASAALNLDVVAFGDAINTYVHLSPTGHPNGDFFIRKKARGRRKPPAAPVGTW